MNLKNKKVLITGATGGIGNCLVKKFENLGAKIIATGTNDEKLNNLKKKFKDVEIEKFKLDEHAKIEQFLEKIDIADIPSNFSTFYSQNIKKKELIKKNVKINNKIIHQSKLLNYINGKKNILYYE